MNAKKHLAALALVASSGCGTLVARDASPNVRFGGVQIDGIAMVTIVLLPLGLADLPFSFVGDCVRLAACPELRRDARDGAPRAP